MLRRAALSVLTLTIAFCLLTMDVQPGLAQTKKKTSRAPAKKAPPKPRILLPTDVETTDVEVAPVSPPIRPSYLAQELFVYGRLSGGSG